MADNTFVVNMKVVGDISDARSNIESLQKSFGKLKLPDKIGGNLNKKITEFYKEYEKYQKKISEGVKTQGDYNQVEKSLNNMRNLYQAIGKDAQKLTELDMKDILNLDTGEFKKIMDEMTSVMKQIGSVKIDTSPFTKAFKDIQGITKNSKIVGEDGLLNRIIGSINTGQITEAKKQLQELQNYAKKVAPRTTADGKQAPGTLSPEKYQQLTGAINSMNGAVIQAETAINPLIEKHNNLQKELDETKQKTAQSIIKNVDDYNKAGDQVDKYTESLKKMHQEEFNFNRQATDISRQIQQYFGLTQIIRKVGDIARDAFSTVKELDKAMTETAVVTNFSVGDMWDMLPTYTAQANQLGSTIRDVYEAATLYYQQGLNTNQAMGLANETLKMARIAGLGAAEATDMMTAALRGFNMEINQQSAQKINDIYSELAAITASDTAEIGSAMERTASIANSANMEFATTSAFLAQMIETTREAPENLGTAMKTIVARFQEMKQDPTKLIDSEGVAMDANKVDKALKTIGVNLMNTKGEFRDLDDVFLDISQRWDSLTQGQQRYIATIAAGSRQQSRFIAMMSNYERTMELVDAANNSAGASQRQFEKTLDSMEAKLNKLKNAWDQFTMGLMNNQILKFGVDALTEGFTILNKLIDILSKLGKPFGLEGLNKSLLTLVSTVGLLKLGGRGASAISGGILGWLGGESFSKGFSAGWGRPGATKAGTEDGKAYAQGFASAVKKLQLTDALGLTKNRAKEIYAENYKTGEYANTFGAAFSQFSAAELSANWTPQIEAEIRSAFQRATANVDLTQYGIKDADEYLNGMVSELKSGKTNTATEAKILSEMTDGKVDLNSTGVNQMSKSIDSLGNSLLKTGANLQAFGMALQDTPLAPFGAILSKVGMLVTSFGSAVGVAVTAGTAAVGYFVSAWAAGVPLVTAGLKAIGVGFKTLFAEMGPVGWAILAIMGIIAAYKGLDAIIESNAEKLEKATNAAAAASEAYDSAKQETSELSDSIEQIRETDSAFDGLVAGTAEFNEQLVTANEQILALIDKYPMLNDSKFLSTDKNGLMHINEDGFKAVKEYQKQIQARASAMNLIQTADLNAIENQQKADNLRKVRGAMSTEEYQKNLRDADLLEQRIEAEKQLARQNAIRTNLVNKEVANQEKLASIYVDQYEAKRQAAELEVAPLDKHDIRQRYADYHGYTYEKSTKKIKDVEGNEIDYDDAAIKDEVIEQTVMLDFEANASSLEGILNQIDRDFNHSLNGAFENSSTFISDVLSNNAEANEDLLEQILDNPKQLNDFVEGLSTKEIAAVLGVTESAVESNVSSYQKQLEDKLLSNAQNIIDTNAQANGELAAMLAQAQGQDANAVLISKNLQKGLMQQVTDFTTQQKNTLLNIGKTLESSVGSDAMATFVDGLSKIYRSNDEQLISIAQDWADSINWETATGRLKGYNEAIKMTTENTEHLGEEGVRQMNDLGKAMLESKDEANLLGEAFSEFYNSTDFQEMAENMDKFVDSSGQLNAASVMDMAEECNSLNNLLDTGAISAGGVAAALNSLGSTGDLVLSDLNSKVLELLSNFGQLDDIIASSHRNIENFDWGIDTGEAEDFVKESAEKWNELYKNGEYGNPQLEAYAKWIMGEDKYIALLASKNGDLEATMAEVSKAVNKYSDGFENAWDDLANGEWKNANLSDNLKDLGISVSFDENGDWKWDPGKATTAELQQWLQEVKGIGPEMAQAMIEDWSNYSPDFRAERQKNDFAAGLDSYIGERRTANGGVAITASELNTIAASTGQGVDEVRAAIAERAGIDEKQLEVLQNINEATNEYVTDGAVLNKQLSEAVGAKGQNGWLADYKAKDSQGIEMKNTIDIESAMAGAVERGYTAAQAKSMAYESYTNADKQGKDYYYKGELLEAGKYKTLDQFAERLAEIDQNAQWTKVGQAIADGYLARIDQKEHENTTKPEASTKTGSESTPSVQKNNTNPGNSVGAYQTSGKRELTWQDKVPGWVTKLVEIYNNPPKQSNAELTSGQEQKMYGGVNQETSQLTEAGTSLTNAGTNLNTANVQMGVAAQQLSNSAQQLTNSAQQLTAAANSLNQNIQNNQPTTAPTKQYAPGAPSNIPQNQPIDQKGTITVDNSDANTKLNETKQLAIETRDTINQGANFKVNVQDSGLGKAAKQANAINKVSGNKSVSIKASGTEDTQNLTKAAKDFSDLKNKTIKLGVTVSGLSSIQSAIRDVKSFYNLRDDKVTLTTVKETITKATGSHNHGYISSPSFGSAAKGYGQLGPKGKGGLTLTGELGYEIAWLPDENRSMILGADGPQMINLPGNAVVWTHEQSEKILKQKAIPAGSHSKRRKKNNNDSSSSGSNGGSNKGKGGNSSSGKGKNSTGTNTKKLFEKVNVWWDNFSRRVEARQRAVDKATKAFEKSLKGSTGTYTNASKTLKQYQDSLHALIDENNKGVAHANEQLSNLDSGKGDDAKALISYSYKKGKKDKNKQEWVNLGKYIKFENGAYQVDQNQLDTIKNLEKRKAVADAANQKINDWVGKANSAQDAIDKANEELEKAADTMYKTFDSWKKSINGIYILSKKLEVISGLKDVASNVIDLEEALLQVGLRDTATGQINILNALNDKQTQLQSQLDASIQLMNEREKALHEALDINTYNKIYQRNQSSTEATEDFDAAKKALELYSSFGGNFEKAAAAAEKFGKEQNNEGFYNKVKDILEDIYTAATDAINASKDVINLTQELPNLLGEINDFVIGFKDDMLEGLEEQTQKEIDRMDKLNDSLTKALKNLLDEIKNKLDERRQQEDNAKTESDISKKQQRLAALQADTSGGHQVEIAQLQQEIASAQQDYQRTLEDQLLEKLQRQADLASQQRERQIELLETQKDLEIAAGTSMAQIEELLRLSQTGTDEEKKNAANALRELYYQKAGYYDENTSEEKKKEIEGDFERDFAKYGAYMQYLPSLETLSEKYKDQGQIAAATAKQTTEEKPVLTVQQTVGGSMSGAVPITQQTKTTTTTTTTASTAPKAGQYNKYGAVQKDTNDQTKNGSKKTKAVQYALNKLMGAGLKEDGNFGPKTIAAVKKFQKKYGLTVDGRVGPKTAAKFNSMGYKTGGLADYTGPAWLDGTPSKPELVLNSTDTKNFIALKDVLSKAMGSTNAIENTYGGDTTFEININVDHLNNDYDVDKVAERVKKIIVKDSSYRNVTQVRNFR